MQRPKARTVPPLRAVRRAPTTDPSRRTRSDTSTRVPAVQIAPQSPTIRRVDLPDRFYRSHTGADGPRASRQQMPWRDALEYVTDGTDLGMLMRDGRVLWITSSQDILLPAFREEFAGVDVDAVLEGLHHYARLHPRLKYIWQEDLAALEDLVAEREESVKSAAS